MPMGIAGRVLIDKICAYKPCSKKFKLEKGLRNICCSRECGNKLRINKINNISWVWKNNKIREQEIMKFKITKENKDQHLKTIFSGGYSIESDFLVLYGYSEGEIL